MLRRILPAIILAALAMPAAAAAALPSVTGGQFITRCNFVRSLQVDPIVSPGVDPSAHLHDFFGNTGVTQDSTPASLVGGATVCKLTADTAAYWVPAAYRTDTGAQVIPAFAFAYYRGTAGQTIQSFPVGAEMLAGSSHATGVQGTPIIAWSCGNGAGSSPTLDHPYDCTTTPGVTSLQGVVALVKFPYCWDGTATQPADFAYGAVPSGACPAGFPVKLPQVQIHEHFGPAFQRGDLLTLASGPVYTEHGDFINSWDQATLDHLVAVCLNTHVDCGVVRDGHVP